MSHEELVNAWKDPDLRDPARPTDHPSGEITLLESPLNGGMFMAAMMAMAIMMEGSEAVGTAGCCYCDCTCGIKQGCNRNLCPDPVS